MIQELAVDLWEAQRVNAKAIVCITTNGFVKKSGHCVMGRGCALEAAKRYPMLPYALGSNIDVYGNRVFLFPEYRLATFPVKHNWFEDADPALIFESCRQLDTLMKFLPDKEFLLPRPGCGNGRLDWLTIKEEVLRQFQKSANLVIVSYPQES